MDLLAEGIPLWLSVFGETGVSAGDGGEDQIVLSAAGQFVSGHATVGIGMEVFDETKRIVAASRASSEGYLHHRPRGSYWERSSPVPYRRLPIQHIACQNTSQRGWGRRRQRAMTREPNVISR
jgi:hypothetical protein